MYKNWSNCPFFHFIYFTASKFRYFAEIGTDAGTKRDLLLYHGMQYKMHRSSSTTDYWLCRYNYCGCRARIASCLVDGYVMVDRLPSDIIHTNHKKKYTKCKKETKKKWKNRWNNKMDFFSKFPTVHTYNVVCACGWNVLILFTAITISVVFYTVRVQCTLKMSYFRLKV